MKEYKFTDYFIKEVLRKRPYIKKEWCIWVLENPVKKKNKTRTEFDVGVILRKWIIEP